MNTTIKIGLIGCGLRGTGYISYMRRLNISFVLTAIADSSRINLVNANRDFACGKAEMFDSGEELLDKADIDAVIIATPNIYHRQDAVAAIQKGVPFLMEKPIATSMEDLQAIWDAYTTYNGKVTVGFGLRYTPFYTAIKKVVEKGTIGQILTVNAEELMSDRLSMIFCRSQWRKDMSLTGGLLLEKCCHDIDLLNWLSGSTAKKVSSYSSRSFLTPQKDINRVCDKCEKKDTCRFSQERILNSFKFNTSDTQTENYALYSELIDNRCPYFYGSPYPDHQSVIIEYDNGVLCTFNVIQVQPANRRTIHILGSEGRLHGVIDDDFFTIYHRTGPNDERCEVVRVYPDDFGHNGADGKLTTDFLNLINAKPNPSRAGLKEGIESAIVCLEADNSVEKGQSIDLAPSRKRVFSS